MQRFKLWAKDLKWMECSFGSSMMITFAFLRWVLLLNLFLGLIWFCAIILPFILHPPKVFDWATFKANLADRNFLLALQVYKKYMYACKIYVTCILLFIVQHHIVIGIKNFNIN